MWRLEASKSSFQGRAITFKAADQYRRLIQVSSVGARPTWRKAGMLNGFSMAGGVKHRTREIYVGLGGDPQYIELEGTDFVFNPVPWLKNCKLMFWSWDGPVSQSVEGVGEISDSKGFLIIP